MVSGGIAGLVAITPQLSRLRGYSSSYHHRSHRYGHLRNFHQFEVLPVVLATLASVIYTFTVTFVLVKIVDLVMGLRVSEDEEYVGLDISQHGEKAYA
jgi:ammonia channel protein AmtB